MLVGPTRSVPVYACAAPVDLRKGFDSLCALVREEMGLDPTSGALYLFVSRNRIRAKVLVWDGTGLCLFSKRLEQGRFAPLWSRERDGQVVLSASELALYLEGCELVGSKPLSPREVSPKRLITSDLHDTLSSCSTSGESKIQRL